MKKLVIILAAVLFIAISANVFAQSTGTNPIPGYTHNYSVTGTKLTWSVTKGNLVDPAGSDAVLSATIGSSIDITWAVGLTEDAWYYVHVLDSVGNCSNEKVLAVQIAANPFFLNIVADNATSCYNDPVQFR